MVANLSKFNRKRSRGGSRRIDLLNILRGFFLRGRCVKAFCTTAGRLPAGRVFHSRVESGEWIVDSREDHSPLTTHHSPTSPLDGRRRPSAVSCTFQIASTVPTRTDARGRVHGDSGIRRRSAARFLRSEEWIVDSGFGIFLSTIHYPLPTYLLPGGHREKRRANHTAAVVPRSPDRGGRFLGSEVRGQRSGNAGASPRSATLRRAALRSATPRTASPRFTRRRDATQRIQPTTGKHQRSALLRFATLHGARLRLASHRNASQRFYPFFTLYLKGRKHESSHCYARIIVPLFPVAAA
jgi:hypothetical protein